MLTADAGERDASQPARSSRRVGKRSAGLATDSSPFPSKSNGDVGDSGKTDAAAAEAMATITAANQTPMRPNGPRSTCRNVVSIASVNRLLAAMSDKK